MQWMNNKPNPIKALHTYSYELVIEYIIIIIPTSPLPSNWRNPDSVNNAP